ncbi:MULTISPECIES: hypothetical protein [Psychroserpens]|uniref:Uncharacterized protein n=1 Tax=Psychroserpens luteus TaxID=1434066 RepID=A0ABW5ZW34_9FLAO|nr:hypothetical protein [Psychroserpens luteus]
MKKQNHYIGKIAIFVIMLTISLPSANAFFEPLKDYIPVGFMILIFMGINSRLKYRNGKLTNQLRIPTNYDDINRIMPFIFGIVCTVGGFFALKDIDSNKIFWSLLIFTGILSLILGFLFVPSGIIEINNNELSFVNGSRKKTIEIEKIDSIVFKSSDIIIIDKNQKKHEVDYMNLIESDYQIIKDFLHRKLTNKIEITTCDSNL